METTINYERLVEDLDTDDSFTTFVFDVLVKASLCTLSGSSLMRDCI
jgi:hypothetical protein